ncbi:hypothetical protein TNCV_3491231 [Trichonephila clavipes]|nr:hypothetical protein TNCV_3491231 [Trichonephila clavipes]
MPLGRDTSVLASFTRSRIQNGCLSCFAKTIGIKKKTLVDNFKRAILESKHVNEFRPHDVLWEKISKGMLRNPDRLLKNTDKRMVYIYNNMFFVKKRLYVWLSNGKVGRDSPDSNDPRAHADL